MAQDMRVISRTVVSDSLRPHGLQPIRLLSPWDSAGKNTVMGCQYNVVLLSTVQQSESVKRLYIWGV